MKIKQKRKEIHGNVMVNKITISSQKVEWSGNQQGQKNVTQRYNMDITVLKEITWKGKC